MTVDTTSAATVVIILTILVSTTALAFDVASVARMARLSRPIATSSSSSSSSSLYAVPPPPWPSSLSSSWYDHVSPSFPSSSSSVVSPRILAGTASAALTYLSLIIAYDRPRGSFDIPNPTSTLVVMQSGVPNGGMGLFATEEMRCGTMLGTYPGVLRPANAFYDGKCRRYPNAIGYSWRFTDNAYVIDPTDDVGEVRDFCRGGGSGVPLSSLFFSTILRSWGVSTALCRINEPPVGAGGCSVTARENLDTREVHFELTRDVYPGQELYLDYGLDYDRSGYGRPVS